MNIGKLKYRLALLEPIKESDGMGGRDQIDTKSYVVWADVRTSSVPGKSSATSLRQGKAYNVPVAEESHFAYIRKKAGNGIARGWKVRLSDRDFKVLSVDDISSDEYLILHLQRIEVGV